MASRLYRLVSATVLVALMPTAAPAAFFWKAPNLQGMPVTGAEPGMVTSPLPGATPEELRAALLWNLRSGLNVAALQCQFNETLLTRDQYNVLLANHRVELSGAYQVLSNYFTRTGKKKGQTMLDQYGTRTYSGFSTVQAQLTFCETAAAIGREAIFAPRGALHTIAAGRMQELRNSLKFGGEQQFVAWVPPMQVTFAPLDERCWKGNQMKANCRYS